MTISFNDAYRPTVFLKPYEKNPRLNDEAVDSVARSITDFGFITPIVANEDGVILAGHTRWKAAVKLGLEKVPVRIVVGLTPEQEKAYRIADNRTAEKSEWDMDLLPVELAALDLAGFQIEATGFTHEEFEAMTLPETFGESEEIDEKPGPNVLKYDLTFNTPAERELWMKYMEWLAVRHPGLETETERITADILKRNILK